ncbi:OsmC/Ohr family [Rhizoctonia solani]|nr:OsmC/Ohr family [Rhizoctonia solani]
MLSVLRSSIRRAPVLSSPFQATHRRTVISLANKKYTATAIASGAGWEGRTELEDGSLVIELDTPREMGGSGDGQNPDQLLALGYASCFLGALQLAAKNKNIKLSDDIKVKAAVSFGDAKDSGFGIGVELTVIGADLALTQAAHEICPYSRLFKEGVEIKTRFEQIM